MRVRVSAVGAWGRTIWAIADERAPSALGELGEADLDFDLAYGVVTLGGVDLALEGLEDEGLVSM